MKKGAMRYSRIGNRAILWHLTQSNKTIKDLERLLRKGESTVNKYIKNPMLLRLDQIYLLAGYFNIPFVEFLYSIHINRYEPSHDDKVYLSDTLMKVKSRYGIE